MIARTYMARAITILESVQPDGAPHPRTLVIHGSVDELGEVHTRGAYGSLLLSAYDLISAQIATGATAGVVVAPCDPYWLESGEIASETYAWAFQGAGSTGAE